MFYLLPRFQFKHCILDNWIPSAYSILTTQVMANLHEQSKKSGKRRAGEDAALYESSLWAVLSSFTPIPAALLCRFKSSLRYSSLAGWSLMCIHSCDQTPSVAFLNTCSSWRLQSRAQFSLHSICWECKRTQSPTVHLQKATTCNLTGLHRHYRLPSERRNWFWESKKVTKRGREEKKFD